jgi:hypothetical protein
VTTTSTPQSGPAQRWQRAAGGTAAAATAATAAAAVAAVAVAAQDR